LERGGAAGIEVFGVGIHTCFIALVLDVSPSQHRATKASTSHDVTTRSTMRAPLLAPAMALLLLSLFAAPLAAQEVACKKVRAQGGASAHAHPAPPAPA
jgi:hypothetical protein